jgi:hypothetical protein
VRARDKEHLERIEKQLDKLEKERNVMLTLLKGMAASLDHLIFRMQTNNTEEG